MADPMRFLALLPDGRTLKSSQDPQEVQRAAEEYAAEHMGEGVHLYQHVITVEASPDGD